MPTFQKFWDEEYRVFYYFNADTSESLWTLPEGPDVTIDEAEDGVGTQPAGSHVEAQLGTTSPAGRFSPKPATPTAASGSGRFSPRELGSPGAGRGAESPSQALSLRPLPSIATMRALLGGRAAAAGSSPGSVATPTAPRSGYAGLLSPAPVSPRSGPTMEAGGVPAQAQASTVRGMLAASAASTSAGARLLAPSSPVMDSGSPSAAQTIPSPPAPATPGPVVEASLVAAYGFDADIQVKLSPHGHVHGQGMGQAGQGARQRSPRSKLADPDAAVGAGGHGNNSGGPGASTPKGPVRPSLIDRLNRTAPIAGAGAASGPKSPLQYIADQLGADDVEDEGQDGVALTGSSPRAGRGADAAQRAAPALASPLSPGGSAGSAADDFTGLATDDGSVHAGPTSPTATRRGLAHPATDRIFGNPLHGRASELLTQLLGTDWVRGPDVAGKVLASAAPPGTATLVSPMALRLPGLPGAEAANGTGLAASPGSSLALASSGSASPSSFPVRAAPLVPRGSSSPVMDRTAGPGLSLLSKVSTGDLRAVINRAAATTAGRASATGQGQEAATMQTSASALTEAGPQTPAAVLPPAVPGRPAPRLPQAASDRGDTPAATATAGANNAAKATEASTLAGPAWKGPTRSRTGAVVVRPLTSSSCTKGTAKARSPSPNRGTVGRTRSPSGGRKLPAAGAVSSAVSAGLSGTPGPTAVQPSSPPHSPVFGLAFASPVGTGAPQYSATGLTHAAILHGQADKFANTLDSDPTVASLVVVAGGQASSGQTGLGARGTGTSTSAAAQIKSAPVKSPPMPRKGAAGPTSPSDLGPGYWDKPGARIILAWAPKAGDGEGAGGEAGHGREASTSPQRTLPAAAGSNAAGQSPGAASSAGDELMPRSPTPPRPASLTPPALGGHHGTGSPNSAGKRPILARQSPIGAAAVPANSTRGPLMAWPSVAGSHAPAAVAMQGAPGQGRVQAYLQGLQAAQSRFTGSSTAVPQTLTAAQDVSGRGAWAHPAVDGHTITARAGVVTAGSPPRAAPTPAPVLGEPRTTAPAVPAGRAAAVSEALKQRGMSAIDRAALAAVVLAATPMPQLMAHLDE